MSAPTTKIDTSSEEWRHQCEVRYVLNLGGMKAMKDYIDAVRAKRSKKISDRLADDVRTELEKRRSESSKQAT